MEALSAASSSLTIFAAKFLDVRVVALELSLLLLLRILALDERKEIDSVVRRAGALERAPNAAPSRSFPRLVARPNLGDKSRVAETKGAVMVQVARSGG